MDETTPKKKRGGPKKTVEEKREALIAKATKDAIEVYEYNENPVLGRGSQFNFPQNRMKILEADEDKREFVSKCVNNNLVFFNVGIQHRVSSDDELCERLNWFFDTCAQTNQIPNVEKMCLAIGYAVQTVLDWESGVNPGFSTATKEIIKQAKILLASMDAELASEGKAQPVVYMFRAKNYYGMRDNKDITVTPNISESERVDSAKIEAKYAELPED